MTHNTFSHKFINGSLGKKFKDTSQRGMTIVEVVIAMVILLLTGSALLFLMQSSNSTSAHSRFRMHAQTLIANEAEYLKTFEHSQILPKDTLYTVTVNGRSFEVNRIRIDSGEVTSAKNKRNYYTTAEYEVYVKNPNNVKQQPLRCRLLQGHYHNVTP